MMDVDHFKRVNDHYGHSGGDMALVAVVEAMQDSVRGIDVLGRWGGEEFTALLPGTNLESAHLVADRVRQNIEKLELQTNSGPMRITVSIGVATVRDARDDVKGMLLRADKALYQAKKNGRNQVLTAV